MRYVWETIIQALDAGIAPDELVFRPAGKFSPYMEVSLPDLNQERLTDLIVEVNHLYRHARLFGELLGPDQREWAEARLALFNSVFHALGDIEARSGLDRAEFRRRFISEDIREGLFGLELVGTLECFGRRERRLILGEMSLLYQNGFSLQRLRRLLRRLYPQSITYLYLEGEKRLLIYLGEKRTPELASQLSAIQEALIPIGYKTELFWERHFGIIGVDETMIPGEIMMF